MARRIFFPWEGPAGPRENPGPVLAELVRHRGTIHGTPLEDSLAAPYLRMIGLSAREEIRHPFPPCRPHQNLRHAFPNLSAILRPWLCLPFRQWVFIAVCLAAGPGLVANLIFKDHWGRVRPGHTIEFGGTQSFTPALAIGGECQRHCSFVSGEASSLFIPFFAAAAIFPQYWVALAATGTVLGLAAGLLRLSQGAHFLSDIVFAGVFMGLTVTSIWHLMFGGRNASVFTAFFGNPARRQTIKVNSAG